jgi:hypothetical protein
MEAAKVRLNATYAPSEDIVSREIEGEILIVPLVSGIGDMEDELFTLNETGIAIWKQLDGQKSLKNVIADLSVEFDTSVEEIEEDVIGFVGELAKRGMLVESSKG